MREALSKPHAQRMLTKIPTYTAGHSRLVGTFATVPEPGGRQRRPLNTQASTDDRVAVLPDMTWRKLARRGVLLLWLAGPITDCKRLEQQGGINGTGIRTAPGAPSANGCGKLHRTIGRSDFPPCASGVLSERKAYIASRTRRVGLLSCYGQGRCSATSWFRTSESI